MAPNGDNGASAKGLKKRKRDKNEQSARSKRQRQQQETNSADPDAGNANGIATAPIDSSLGLPTGEGIARSSNGTALVRVTPGDEDSRQRKQSDPASWRLLEPMGGRMSDIDPIFTPDEE